MEISSRQLEFERKFCREERKIGAMLLLLIFTFYVFFSIIYSNRKDDAKISILNNRIQSLENVKKAFLESGANAEIGDIKAEIEKIRGSWYFHNVFMRGLMTRFCLCFALGSVFIIIHSLIEGRGINKRLVQCQSCGRCR